MNENAIHGAPKKIEYEDKEKWIVWFDGASNVLGHGIGAVLVSPEEEEKPDTNSLKSVEKRRRRRRIGKVEPRRCRVATVDHFLHHFSF